MKKHFKHSNIKSDFLWQFANHSMFEKIKKRRGDAFDCVMSVKTVLILYNKFDIIQGG